MLGKKFILQVLGLGILILSCSNVHARYTFQHISAIQRDACLIDSLNMYVTGTDGKLIFSSDGGNKWIWIETGFRGALNKMSFTCRNSCLIACDSGTVLSTTDAGKTWKITVIDTSSLIDIKMLNLSTGFAASKNGKIFKTTDSGKSWNVIYNSGFVVNAISFPTENCGFIAGNNNHLVKTTDGGSSWVDLFDGNQRIGFSDIDFYNESKGIITGFDTTIRKPVNLLTNDGGNNWKSFTDTRNLVNCVRIINDTTAFLAGMSGYIYKTSDFGNSWSVDSIPLGGQIYANPYFSENINCISADIYGHILVTGQFSQFIAVSSDNAKSFDVKSWCRIRGGPVWNNSSCLLNAIKVNDNEIIASGQSSGVYKSKDNGITWHKAFPFNQEDISLTDYSCIITGGYFFDEKNGFLAGSKNQTNAAQITIVTHDGGNTWQRDRKDSIEAYSVSFFDSNNGFAVADSVLYRTTDGTNSWSADTIVHNKEMLNRAGVSGSKTGYLLSIISAVKTNDTINYPTGYKTAFNIYKTIDGGKTFSLSKSIKHQNTYYRYMTVRDSDNIFIYGSGPEISFTNDGGKEWKTLSYPEKMSINDMIFLDSLNAIAAGSNDQIFFSSDGCRTWQKEKLNLLPMPLEVDPYFNKIVKLEKNDFLLVGNGRIVKVVKDSDSTTGTEIENSHVERYNPYFYIKVNPNPAKSLTRFELFGLISVKDKPISVTVLDYLGNQVADLTSLAEQNRENNTSFFSTDLSFLPSGVYFIRLSSDGYLKTEKFAISN